MTEKLKLGLLFGGRSGEHAVSLMSARSVLSVLSPEKYEVFQIGISLDGVWLSGVETLRAFKNQDTTLLYPVVLRNEFEKVCLYRLEGNRLEFLTTLDVVFPILHGTFGEDGTLQGLLEINNCAYIGAGVLASSVGMDKAVCKHVVQNQQVPVLAYKVFNRSDVQPLSDLIIRRAESVSPYPLFVKPANLGSSVGISKVHNREELKVGLLKAAKYDRRILVEQGIEAREIEISVLGNENPVCSIPGEIVPDDIFYTYEDKYFRGEAKLLIPAPINSEQSELVQDYALTVYKAIDCAGMARVDFLMDKNTGAIYFNEINTIPGFTSISMYSKLWQASGLDYESLVDKLIALALERKSEQDKTVRGFEE